MDNLLKSLWTNVSPYFSDSSSKIQSKFVFELLDLLFEKQSQGEGLPQLLSRPN